MEKKGKLYGVGVGPGDPELVTVKALNVMRSCATISFPAAKDSLKASAFEIARAALPELAGRDLLPLDLPMTRDAEKLKLGRETAAHLLAKKLDTGRDIAFLTLGDPSIYSTFGYLRQILEKQGYETETIPGITSFCAAAAALGEDLALWEEALHIIPASCRDLAGAVAMPGTRVLMKSGSALGEVKLLLEANGLADNTRVVENCGMANQRIWKKLSAMDDTKAGYFTLLVIKEGTP